MIYLFYIKDYCEILKSDRESIQAIFLQPSHCKALYENFGSLLLMDGTYKLTNIGFTTITIACIDNNFTAKLLSWALVSNETMDILVAVLNLFKDANDGKIDKTLYIVVDKDFTEIAGPLQKYSQCLQNYSQNAKETAKLIMLRSNRSLNLNLKPKLNLKLSPKFNPKRLK